MLGLSVAASTRIEFGITAKILLGMALGMVFGLAIFYADLSENSSNFIMSSLQTGSSIFINIMKMLVVPVVFVSLVGGVASIGKPSQLGRIGAKTLLLYLITTCIAISLAILIALVANIGSGGNLSVSEPITIPKAASLSETFINMIPTNPFQSFAEANMLQIIVFAVLIGFAITMVGSAGKRIKLFFSDFEKIIMQLVIMMVKVTPIGVFCLIGNLFAKQGLGFIGHLLEYFLTVFIVLIFHLLLVNSTFLFIIARLHPLRFFRKMLSTMLFAFSTSSSNVSIPIVMETAEDKLGVDRSIASFVIPLGATINMDGTAIMQGVATVFIANIYHIDIGITGYLTVIVTATLASVGTAGVPGVGLITLAMVLRQVGLPIEGIALIIGADRLLDMLRTAVNITGDAMISCVVAHTEKKLDRSKFEL